MRSPYKIIAATLTFLACISGMACKKFLDEPQRSSYSMLDNVKAVLMVLDNVFIYSGYPTDAQFSADDFYLADADFDAIKDEMSRKTYLRAADAQMQAGADWYNAYRKVYHANVALGSLDDIAAKDKGQSGTNDFRMARGFALFVRANVFFEVAQLYTAPYNPATATQNPGIPLRVDADLNAVSERGTLQQTYDRIIADLQESLELLPATTVVATRPGKAAVYALLARVYMVMENYPAAGKAADECLRLNSNLVDYNTISQTSATPFVRFNPEVIYHCHMTSTSNYNVRKIAPELYNSYEANDLRKVIFFKQNTGNNVGTYYFTGNYEPSATFIFNGTAVDEMYLVRAECRARAGSAADAMSDLNTLLRKRYVTGSYTDRSAASADDALVQVLTERRKELVYRNRRWSDLRRLNNDPRFAITLTRTVKGVDYTLPPKDPRYALLLPLDVVTFSKMEQNAR